MMLLIIFTTYLRKVPLDNGSVNGYNEYVIKMSIREYLLKIVKSFSKSPNQILYQVLL